MEISQKIIDYAIRYYLRYYPSPKKLAQKLKMKFGKASENGKKYGGIDDEVINYIIKERLKNIIEEDEVIKSKIRSYIKKGKSKIYIKQKLYKRQENKELIEKYLEKFFINGEFETCLNEYNKIDKKIGQEKIIRKLLSKGFRYDDIKKATLISEE